MGVALTYDLIKAHLPTAGTYALYFDYQVDGVVNTAVTKVEVHDGAHH